MEYDDICVEHGKYVTKLFTDKALRFLDELEGGEARLDTVLISPEEQEIITELFYKGESEQVKKGQTVTVICFSAAFAVPAFYNYS